MSKKTSSQLGDDVSKIMRASDRASSPMPRALAEMEEFTYPGASEVATLTVAARSLDWQFEPVMQALRVASKIEDWSHSFLVAEWVKDGHSGPRFNWKNSPWRKYRSFEHFYSVELERTFGTWESLQHTWNEIVKGKITEAEAHKQIAERAARAKKIDAQDRENKRPVGTNQYSEGVNNKNKDVNTRPQGNSVANALRRLRKDRPDIHQRVLDGEISANAGMIEAGFRKKRERKKLTPLDHLNKWWDRATPEQRAQFWAEKAERPQRGAA